jgi:pimeloyl-ACP methyl ester carboxylesterase
VSIAAQIEQRVETRVCQVNGYDIRYRVLGEGPPALLLHGWGASWHYWQWLMPALAGAGYCVYVPDLLGHGDSAKPVLDYDSAMYFSFAQGLVEVLGLERFVLAGHSLGGYIALHLAETWPERVSRLVLVNPVYRPDQLRWSFFSFMVVPALGELALRLVPPRLVKFAVQYGCLGRSGNVPPSFLQQAAINYKRATPRIAGYRIGIPDLRPDLARVTAPTLVVWGEQDPLLSPRSFRELTQMLPLAQAWPFPNAGHSPLVESPSEFNGVVVHFLKNMEL